MWTSGAAWLLGLLLHVHLLTKDAELPVFMPCWDVDVNLPVHERRPSTVLVPLTRDAGGRPEWPPSIGDGSVFGDWV